MRKSPILFLLLTASAVSLGWGCGDDGSGTGGSGASSGAPCDRDADCENTDCSFGFCISGFCEFQQADDGPAPGAEQTDGDCMSIDCAAGELVTAIANDPAEDPDGSDCMVPSCDAGDNVMIADELGSGCDAGSGSGVCDSAGVCSCEILTEGDAIAYVDPDNGQDIATNGGAQGSCAFATIEYALTQAPGEIRLPAQDFTITEPLVLTGAQRLNCRFDDQNNVRTRLLGHAAYGATDSAAVVFEGMANAIDDCEIDLQGGGTAAVIVASAAMGVPHVIDDSILGNSGGDGVRVDGNNVQITDSNIHDNATNGVSFVQLDATANLENNTFTANGTDLLCADASMSVTGENNNLASCTTCANCMDL